MPTIIGEVFDTSGQNNHGRAYGGVERVEGKIGKAVKFDGLDDYVSLNNSVVNFGWGNYAFVLWVKPTANPSHSDCLFSIRENPDATVDLITLYRDSSRKMYFSVRNNGANVQGCYSSISVPVDEWHCIAVGRNGSQMFMFIDGVNVTVSSSVTGDVPSWEPSTVFGIGKSDGFYGYPWEGIIDEVRIYNLALSADEIQTLYKAERITNGLIGEWRFEDHPYKVITYDPVDVGWEDDSFASGWVANYCSLTRDGDIAKLELDTGYAGGWIQKDGLNINALTYKYCVVCVKGTDRFFVEVYDGSWKSITSGHETAPSEYDVEIYDLSGITTGIITNIRLGVGDAVDKEAYYDFLAFCSVQPLFCTDKALSLFVKQRETDVDEFEITGTDDIGSGLTIGRHLRIFLKGSLSGSAGELRKVFAGVIEENTPDDASGKVLHITGRCFGQKLLLRTKSKNFNVREVSLAVKDFVSDLTEITTHQVETPSPTVYITKEFPYEYIIDGLRDLAKQAGSDWEVKLGMGQDLRFRSRASANVPSLPLSITEADGHILRDVRKETDGYRAYNKVTVLGGEMSNIDGDIDKYTDEGDKVTWNWQVFGEGPGSYVYEDSSHIAYGKVSMRSVFTYYSTSITTEFDRVLAE